jgi:hypothetical protein
MEWIPLNAQIEIGEALNVVEFSLETKLGLSQTSTASNITDK